MTRRALESVMAPVDATLRRAIEVVDASAMSVALLVDERTRLVGLLTDGDVRRAILAGAALEEPALPFATRTPHVAMTGTSRAHVLDLMRSLRIVAVPEVDEDRRIVGLHTLSDIVGAQPLPNPAVIMAGGRGTRLGKLTRDTPKPLMEVAGRSILEWIVLTLVSGGVRDVSVSVNHLADQIEEHLGDGSRLGCKVSYLREDPDRPLGTAGSLTLFRAQRPELEEATLVMNGDLMVEFEADHLLTFHERHDAAVTVTTRPYTHEVPFGVVETGPRGTGVTSIREKPSFTVDVNAGVYAVAPRALDMLAPDVPSTMPELIQQCLDRGETVAAWPVASDWIDVGTPSDLARAKGQA